MSSISDILQQTLDLIGSEEGASNQQARGVPPVAMPSYGAFGIAPPISIVSAPQVESKTASSVLLEERKKLKEKMEEINAADFTSVSTDGRPKFAPMNAYLDQITSGAVDKPKYWKTKKGGSGAVSSNKKTIEKRSKGSDYNDRLMNKLQTKQSKQKLKNSVKGK
jgi:hypothetical protein